MRWFALFTLPILRTAPARRRRWLRWMTLVGLAAGSVGQAQAQAAGGMKPGLWEVSAQVQGGAGGAGKTGAAGGDLAAMLAMAQQQWQNLPPEQRQRMEALLKERGVALGSVGPGGSSVRVCVTPEQAEREELPQAEERCTQQMRRSGRVVHYTFSCQGEPPMSGEGEYTLHSPTSASGRTVIRTTVAGRAQTVTMDNRSNWIGASCGELQRRSR